MVMRPLILLAFMIPLIICSQNVIKIDNEEMLISTVFENNSTYLLKSNVIYNINKSVHISGKSNITIGSYGEGEMPIIQLTENAEGDVIVIRSSKNITIENLKLFGDYDHSIVHIAGHYITEGGICQNITVKNCEVAFGFNGIRSLPYKTKCRTINVINCNIHHVNDDGIFIVSCDDVTVDGCHIWHVNLYWNKGGVNAGDCIHLVNDCNNWKVRNNTFDRRLTSNKFCFIYGTNDYRPIYGELTGNTFYPPKDTVGGVGSAIYISTSDYVKIDSNIFLSDGYEWGGKPGAIAHIEATNVDFSRNYINHLTNCNFTTNVQKVTISENVLVDCFSFVFKYAHECFASDNTFYNLKGWAYVAGKNNNANLSDNNTIYLEGYPEQIDSLESH